MSNLAPFPLLAQTIANREDPDVSIGIDFIDPILNLSIFNISVWRIIIFGLLFVFALIFRRFILHSFFTKAGRALTKTKTEWDNKLLAATEAPLGFLILTIALWFSLLFLKLPPQTFAYIALGLRTIGAVFVAWMVFRSIDVLHEMLTVIAARSASKMDDHLVPLVRRILRVVLIIVTALTILQQWGYQVSSIIAGLGIGGLAFALAAQDTLGNWFGSLMIFTDRPFVVGDYVKFNSKEGIIEDVGLRSTRLRTFEKTIITIPNKTLAATSIENISARNMMRIRMDLGLEYETSSLQMRTILAGLRTRFEDDEMLDSETIVIAFTGLGESSLDVFISVFVKSVAYATFLEIRQEVLLDIMAIVEEAGSGFAFPSQTIYTKSGATPT